MRSKTLFCPLVLLHDLTLFLRREIIFNHEELPNFLYTFVLDQARNLGTGEL